MSEPVKCYVCGAQVFRGKNGGLLIHTTLNYAQGKTKPEICAGYRKGARP